MNVKIFYSWQSDIQENVNKFFIEKAIKRAIAKVTQSNVELDLVLDRDTQGVAGTPSIADTILEKIEQCDIFIGDLTYVTKRNKNGEPCPNPNVLFELGFAVGKKNWDCIINVLNKHYGEAKDLPFDLKYRRWPICYTLEPNAEPDHKSQVLTSLVEQFKIAIDAVIRSGVLVKQASYAKRLRKEEFDRDLYEKIKSLFHESDGVSYLRNHDFHNPFNSLLIDSLFEYVDLCKNVDFGFYNDKAKQLNDDLKVSVIRFLEYVASNTFPHPVNPLHQTIVLDPYSDRDFFVLAGKDENDNEELTRERRRERSKAGDELNNLSREIADRYFVFVKYTRLM